MDYACCPFCATIFDVTQPEHHIKTCEYALPEGACSICGEVGRTLRTDFFLYWCSDCLAANKSKSDTDKYYPYLHLFMYSIWTREHDIQKLHIHKQLIYYISDINIDKVTTLLEQGANPNYRSQADTKLYVAENFYRYVYCYNADGTERPESDFAQPSTGLKMCVFRMSDPMLSDEEKEGLIKITKLLLRYGATGTEEARKYFLSRYTIHTLGRNNEFARLYSLLRNASRNLRRKES